MKKTGNNKKWKIINIWAARVIFCFIVLGVIFHQTLEIKAEGEARKTVRVGYYNMDGYHNLDEDGHYSGYGYDFLQMIGRYLPYSYEYVGYEKSWNEMLEMLQNGEIDIVTGGARTEEREKIFAYSDHAIGTNITVLAVREDDTTFESKNYDTYDGTVLGFVKSSFRTESFRNYAELHHFSYVPVYYDTFAHMDEALQKGLLDGIVCSNLRRLNREKVLDQFDYNDFYVMTVKGNEQLMDEIDEAIEKLDKDEPGWRTSLMYQYYGNSSSDRLSLTAEERNYLQSLEEKGTVLKILVNPDRKPYSYFEDGEAKGIIPSVFACTADALGISYEIIETKDRDEYYRMLKDGEADICIDMGSDYSEAERLGYELTDAYMSSGFSRITRHGFSDEIHTVASIKKSFLLSEYLDERFSDGKILYYNSLDECIQAVKNGEADAAFFYTYTVQEIMKEDFRNTFDFTITSGEYVSFSMGVRRELESGLLTSLNKALRSIRNNEIESIILETTENIERSGGLIRFLYTNPGYGMVLVAVAGLIALISGIAIMGRKSRKKLLIAYEEVKAANNAKKDFLSKMSHDIRTPMNAIMGMTEILALHADDEKFVRDYLDKMRVSEKYLLGLLNEVLDMNRIDSGTIELKKEPFLLPDLLEDISVMIHELADAKEQELELDTAGIRHPSVKGDAQRLEQILVNLLVNATKYTDSGGKILLRAEEEADGCYCFHVKDNGMGIPKDFQDKIYDAFSRAEDSRVSRIQGTGLGMAIVKGFVELMDGKISVISEVGKGTEFIVHIPLEINETCCLENADDTEKIKEGIQDKKREGVSGLHVLLVEDNDLNREIAQELLSSMGVSTDCAVNGRDGVEQFLASRPGTFDVILMDLQMPVMNGIEACRQIRSCGREDREIPVIALTANAYPEDIENCRAAGMNAHISKPVDMQKLYEHLQEICGRK